MKAAGIALLLVLSSAEAKAEDVASVMAALKDQKAECRYLRTLQQRIRDALDHSDPDGAMRAANSGAAAADVLRAKYGKLPDCDKVLGK